MNPAKCNKVKNPCKICLSPVTQKTGLQCQGACESWVHYACLNYTPGRIKDIKAGIIKVMCPCPDCKTVLPKEYRTDAPFSCSNMHCPANNPPQCVNMKCPVNVGLEKMIQTPMMSTPCPLNKCGNECKQHSSPMLVGKQLQQPCGPPPMPSTSDACINHYKCPSGCSSKANVSGDMMRNMIISNIGRGNVNAAPINTIPSFNTMEQINNTLGLLSAQINEMMERMQTIGQLSDKKGCAVGPKPPPSPECPPSPGCAPSPPPSPPRHAGQAKSCYQKGPKTMCPKPCYCPSNPVKRG